MEGSTDETGGQRKEGDCPLTTPQLVDLILRFIDLFNQPAKIHLYAYQRVFIRRIIESLLVHDGQVITGLWSRQCLAGDTVILDRDGSACRIKDHPRAWQTDTDRLVYRVRAQNGFEVRATDNHPFLTKRGWVRVDQLEAGDELCVLDEWDRFGDGRVEHDQLLLGFSEKGERPTERAPDGEDGERRLWSKLISVEPDGHEDVYDIEYPGKGWFFAQGIAVHNSGKSEALSSLAVASCVIVPTLAKAFPTDDRLSQYVNGLWIGIFAPKQQQSGIIYERIRHRASRQSSEEIYADPDIGIAVSQSRGDQVSWTNGSFVSAQTASEQSNVEGKTFHIVFIDEAQLVGRSKVQKEISPMLAATNGSMVKIGTASISRGGFHDSITHNLEQQQKKGVRNHFEFPYDLVIREKRRVYEQTGEIFHLNYEKWVATEIERVGGTENDEFKMNFRLMWQEMSTGAIDRECFFLSRDEEAEANNPKGYGRLVAAIDLGKAIDDTVITVIEEDDVPIVDMRAITPGGKDERVVFYTKHIIAWAEAHGKWESQLDQILGFLSNYAIDVCVVDSTGVGDPISERLATLMPGVRVIPVPLSLAGNDRIYKYYLQELEAGRLRYPAGPRTVHMKEFQKFVHQHEVLGKTYKGPNSSYISCGAPDGEHDDYCDSAALAVWATNTPREAEVVTSFDTGYSGGSKGFTSRSERYRTR